MFTEFIYVRHGETDANRNDILQGGGIDMPLNECGIKQAEAVAEYLQNEHFDAAFSSPLIRARQTMEKIISCGHNDVVPEYPDALREWNCGKLDGMPWSQIKKDYPKESLSFCFEQIEVQMPDGECGVDVQARVENFLKSLVADYPGKRILLVAHGGVFQRILRCVAGVVNSGNMIPLAGNASVSTFCFNHKYNAWQLTSLNRTDHLKGLPQYQTKVS